MGCLRILGQSNDAESTDPLLPEDHSTFESYTTPVATYPRIRTFHHPQSWPGAPLLVFIHGLGGSTAQFAPLIANLTTKASCLSIDLPGCGRSSFKPEDSKAYTIAAFSELVRTAIERYKTPGQKVVLIGHSMGCSTAALLCSSASQLHLNGIAGLVAICAKSSPPAPKQQRTIKRLRFLPPFLLDILRFFDNIGGVESPSIKRFCGKDSDIETRKLQMQFNAQSKSEVFLRHVQALAIVDEEGKALFPGQEVWSNIDVPLYLIAAERDTVCPVREVETVARWLGCTSESSPMTSSIEPDRAALPAAASDASTAVKQLTPASEGDAGTEEQASATKPPASRHATTSKGKPLSQTVFPAPASHALPYTLPTLPLLSSMIQDFISKT